MTDTAINAGVITPQKTANKHPKIKVCDKTTAGNERSRVYHYPADSGQAPLKVVEPVSITILPNGAHLVLDRAGRSNIIKPGFVRIVPVYYADCLECGKYETPKV